VSRLLITGATVVTVDDAGTVHTPGVVAVDGERIAHVGPEAPEGFEDAERIDGEGCVAIPGLVNAHTHSGMTVMRGAADDQPLMPWLEERIWPMEARLTAEDVYWGASLACLEMLRGGVTCFADMYKDGEQAARAAADAGIRALVGEALFGVQPGAEDARRRAVETAQAWAAGGDALVRMGLAPHALYTCPPDFLGEVVDDARTIGLPLQIHVSETEGEVARTREQFGGRTPVAVLDDLGVLSVPLLAAHCVWVDDADRALLAERGAAAVHNPSSNMKLGSGVADVGALLAAGVTVALGTDSAASNNTLSVLTEMRIAALLAKVGGDPTALPARTALGLATRGGARAVGLGEEIGTLAPGRAADVVLIRLDGLHAWPPNDPVSHLAYAVEAGDVDTVVVAGRLRLRGGEWVDGDPDRVRARAAEVIARVRV